MRSRHKRTVRVLGAYLLIYLVVLCVFFGIGFMQQHDRDAQATAEQQAHQQITDKQWKELTKRAEYMTGMQASAGAD